MECGNYSRFKSRREILAQSGYGLGIAALHALLGGSKALAAAPSFPNFPPRAKRVIYLFQSGGPSHLDLLDYKPKLKEQHGIDLPESVRMGQRLTGMTSGQKTKPVAASKFGFAQHGGSGTWISELLPHTAKIVDDICLV